ncbi:fibrous sheath-interacting protein 1-like [Halichondria panicea]|uniref:fibrous sheath-interacting protein 1-like n=1 Tax=Halichondria panicea TaxID=6063 RepID=UPI00312B7E40
MSYSNVMEVITKGRYVDEASDTAVEPVLGRSSTSQSTRTESQLSLEYLPPEAPYYGSASAGLQGQDPQDLDQEVQAEATTQLYQRIQALSDQIHTELDTMIDIESVSSHQPTPLPPEEHSMRTSLDTSRDSDLFLLEQIHSNINSDKCKDIVLVPDKEEDVLSPRDCDSTLTASSATVEPLFNSMDPKLKKAIEKMRKLDEKLADLDKKERDVKKQRKLLEQQIDSNISLQTSSTHSLDRQKYPPVFTTQLNDNASSAGDSTSCTVKSHGSAKRNHIHSETEKTADLKTKPNTQTEISGTNFIQRNIELASDAGALVAMTEAEKQRLDELLSGENKAEEIDPNENELILCVRDIREGFALKQEDLDRMKTIDNQLQAILPPSAWESLSCSSRTGSHNPQELGSESGHISTIGCDSSTEDEEGEPEVDKGTHIGIGIVPGEEVLHQFQMSRSESERLRSIDDRLRAIHAENQLILPLPTSDLQALLDECRSGEQLGTHKEFPPRDENTNKLLD